MNSLQPETCETCGGTGTLPEPPKVGTVDFHTGLCSSCHGRGTVYPTETVDLIADALASSAYKQVIAHQESTYNPIVATRPRSYWLHQALSVLDALNGEAS